MNDIAVRAENLGKRYRIGQFVGYRTMGEMVGGAFSSVFRRSQGKDRSRRAPVSTDNMPPDDFTWALKDVSFEVRQGEAMGIIGRNGAGKTTLLRILTRITDPTEGWAEIRGKVGSLLEVGSGFHPELTGRENVYLNGAVLGMTSKEIKRKFDEIVDFSGVEKFIDTPLKRYSSGMQVRLAFAVAAYLEPEVLLVDEVLAVGDADFQNKCLGKMGDIVGAGRTVLFISHNMGAILRLTGRCILLQDGQVLRIDESRKVVEYYISQNVSRDAELVYAEDTDKLAQILRVAIRNKEGHITPTLDPTDDIRIELDFVIRDTRSGKIDAAVTLALTDGTIVLSFITKEDVDISEKLSAGRYRLHVVFPGNILNCGTYIVRGAINLNGKSYHNHPNIGEGLYLELTEASDIGGLNYGRGNVLAVRARPTLEKL